MNDFTIKVDDREVQRLFQIMQKRGMDTSLTNQKVAIFMHKSVIRNLNDQKDETGKAWKPLSPATLLRRRTRKKPPPTSSTKMLVDTGSLRRSIRWKFGRNSATVTAGGTKEVGYARIHHFGGMAGRGRKVGIPARPYMYVTDKDVQTIVKFYEKDLFQQ